MTVDALGGTHWQDRLDRLNPAGWPRPRLPTRKGVLPAPYIADLEYIRDILRPADMAPYRADIVFHEWRCQVCGGHNPDGYAYAPVTAEDYNSDWPGILDNIEIDDDQPPHLPDGCYLISGGPVCSIRCCRLVLAMCPHFRDAPGEPSIIRFDRADTSEHCTLGGGRILLVTRWTYTSRTENPR